MLTSIIPAPYRLLAGAIAIALTLITVYALGRSHGADHVQAEWDAETVRQLRTVAQAEAASRAAEQSMQQKLNEAQNAATERETKLRADAGAARAAATGLRNDLAAVRDRLPAATADACRATASAALELFGTCADEYRAVAEASDGHGSDVKTLSDAWPK